MRVVLGIWLLLAATGFWLPQADSAPGGATGEESVSRWEIDKIEEKIQLTLNFEQELTDLVTLGPGVYKIKIFNSSPRPPYHVLEEILRSCLADYVTVLNRDYSLIRGRKTEKSAAPEFQVDPAKNAQLVTVVPLALRKITRITKIEKAKYGDRKIIEFLYNFEPNMAGAIRRSDLKGRLEYLSDRQEGIISLIKVVVEDQGILEFNPRKQ